MRGVLIFFFIFNFLISALDFALFFSNPSENWTCAFGGLFTGLVAAVDYYALAYRKVK